MTRFVPWYDFETPPVGQKRTRVLVSENKKGPEVLLGKTETKKESVSSCFTVRRQFRQAFHCPRTSYPSLERARKLSHTTFFEPFVPIRWALKQQKSVLLPIHILRRN
ncbi:hypothetical protein THAOC_02422 [Thalassiosira oceanica]|uniref:Uncharacterized protein n=1 Tax=Thalassiosira oceanica TaxID=159749 RepID=K0TQD2_THAOC|nr:hypothetical protein THAOC_02422 [Thalassiosira oceanica]|eukprot:EJK75842.1 hypothetical protein THAOC_02422 [Thalassiosira oceanica]